MTRSDELLIRAIPQALASTERVCSSVNVGSTKCGIDMDAVRLMGEIILETARQTKEKDSLAVPSLWYSATRRMTIPLWREPSTA